MARKKRTEAMKLDMIISKYNEEAGVTVIGPLKDFDLDIKAIPTGNLILDAATGIGGFALGKLYEVVGDKASGKSSLCISLARQHLRFLDKKVLYVDIENASTATLFNNFGVFGFEDRFLMSTTAVAEYVLDAVLNVVSTGEVSLVIIDSIPSILPSAEMDKGLSDKEQIGERARLIQRFILKANPLLGATKTTMVLINQLRTDIKKASTLPMANPMKSTGGKAVEYFPSCKVILSALSPHTAKERCFNDLGIRVAEPIRATIGKNRLALTCDLGKPSTLRLGFGFDAVYDLIDISVVACQLTNKGGWYYMDGNSVAHGARKLYDKLLVDKELRDSLIYRTMPLVSMKDTDTVIDVVDDFVERKVNIYDPGRITFAINPGGNTNE